MNESLVVNEWQRREVERAIKEIQDGLVTPHEEVFKYWKEKYAQQDDE